MLKLLPYAVYLARNPIPSAVILLLFPLVSLSVCAFLLIDKILFDRILATFDGFLLAKVGLAFLVATVFLIILNLLLDLCVSLLTGRVSAQIKEDLAAELLEYEYGFFLSHDSGYIVKRIVEDSDQIADGVVKAFNSISHILQIAVSAFVYHRLGWGIFSAYCITAAAQIAWALMLKIPIEKSSDSIGMGYSKMYDYFWECLPGIREIKLQGIQGHVRKRLRELENNIGSHLWRNSAYNSLLWFLVSPVSTGFLLMVMLAGLRKVQAGQISTGIFVLLLGLVQATLDPLRRLMESLGGAHRARSAIKRIESLKGDFKEPTGNLAFRGFSDRVRLEGATLSFESGRKGLAGLDMEIPKGAYVAIVGETGSGKSSIAHVLVKLFRNYSGKVAVDDHDLSSLETVSLRDKVTLVTQDIFLFRGSIRENIDPHGALSDSRLREICMVSQLEDFVGNLPHGLETQIGEDGTDFSGGERQRISIARCLAKDPDIVILDEATSALDPRTQERLMSGLSVFLAGKTIISITHNARVAERASLIFVLEGGTLADSGSHEELMKKEGIYKRLFSMQDSILQRHSPDPVP